MKSFYCAALAVALLAAATTCLAGEENAWRIGLTYLMPDTSVFRTYDEGIQGVRLEYCLGDTFKDQDIPADASIALGYSRISYTQDDLTTPVPYVRRDVGLDVYTLGTNIRFGGGAKPGCEGSYAGCGFGFALCSPPSGTPTPNFAGFGSSGNNVAFQYSALVGINYAKALYSELSYARVNQDGVFALTTGVRF